MNDASWETELTRCYAAFDERHAELRAELQAKLIESAPRQSTAAGRREAAGRRRLLSRLAVAACLLIGTGALLTVSWGPRQAVYGLDDLPKRLLAVRSIYLRGKSHFPERPDRGIEASTRSHEYYLERPHRYFKIGSANSADGIQQHRVYSDGERHLEINDGTQTAVLGKEAPQAAEYTVESWIQSSFVQQLLGGPTTAGFEKVRSEPLDGTPTDVYERKFQYPDRPHRSRVLVWLNPATGLPLRIEQFHAFADNPEELGSTYDKIEINGDPPAGTFDFTPPAGYAVEHRDVSRDKIGSEMSAGTGIVGSDQEAFHALRFCFNIDDRAALVCWSQYSDFARPHESDLEGPLGRRLGLSPTSYSQDRTYANYFLRVDPAGKFHWRWSLVMPEGDDRTQSEAQLVFSLTDDTGLRGTLTGTPLRFERKRLAQWIVEAQRLTLPADAPADAIFTLERIEELIEEFRRQEDSLSSDR